MQKYWLVHRVHSVQLFTLMTTFSISPVNLNGGS
jgi:hypothetical protein